MEARSTARKKWIASRTVEVRPTDRIDLYIILLKLDDYLSFLCLEKSFTESRPKRSKNSVFFAVLLLPPNSRI
jgi:hypothetical protein